MSPITIASILVTLAAVFSYVNYRLLKLPTTIGIMILALLTSVVVLVLPSVGLDISPWAQRMLSHVNFSETLLHGMLAYLLFAGALHVNLSDLKGQRWAVGSLALFGTLFSTLIVGLLTYYLSPFVGLNLPFMVCFLFGALISPTDPVAVMAILRTAGVNKALETKVVGESLFNDGIAVVVFLVLLHSITNGNEAPHIGDALMLFTREAIGGIFLGMAMGGITILMLRDVHNYQLEILLTLALVMGGYELALLLHTSGPIAMVVAGLLIGNHGKKFAMLEETRQNLDHFWELVDEFLNAVLFLLIGLEVLILPFNEAALIAGLVAIPLLLAVRFAAVGIPITILSRFKSFSAGSIRILTWGGLRGGISVALVLSMQNSPEREILLTITYVIVLFSIIIQGLTVGPYAKRIQNQG